MLLVNLTAASVAVFMAGLAVAVAGVPVVAVSMTAVIGSGKRVAIRIAGGAVFVAGVSVNVAVHGRAFAGLCLSVAGVAACGAMCGCVWCRTVAGVAVIVAGAAVIVTGIAVAIAGLLGFRMVQPGLQVASSKLHVKPGQLVLLSL